MLFYFDFANYRRMLRLAWREKNPRARTRSLAVLVLAVPAIALFHTLCFALDGLLFPRLWRVKVTAPVFLVGHARSGTTLTHRLMSRDAGRFSSFRLYECYFPSLLQKRGIRLASAFDRRWLGGFLARRVRAWEERRYGAQRHVHEMGLSIPEEDDIVLYWSLASGFWITKLPYMGELDFYHVNDWPAAKRRRLHRFYRECVRRQLYLNGPEKTHLAKNPLWAGRVAALIEAFPDARFVVNVRDPRETIPSLLKLMRGGWKRLGWTDAEQQRSLRILAEQSFHSYRHPLETLAAHPATKASVVDYRELTSDPAAAIERIYRDLDLPLSDAFRAALAGEGKRERRPAAGARHRYSLEEFGLAGDAIRERLADLFERFQWDADAAGARRELRAAWDDLIASLERARDAIDQPELMPPPPSARNLAEGYRYLVGFVHSAVERAFHADPARPAFRNALSIVNRATIDNADAVYFYAPIDGRAHTWIRGEPPAATGRKAPHYVTFEATAGAMTGDSGDLRELAPGVKARTGLLDSSALEVAADGSFEILLAPERPPGHRGNFIATRKLARRPDAGDSDRPAERFAELVSGRQLFYDWEREDAIPLAIHQLGAEGTAPPAYGPEQAAAELRRCGELVRGQMHFWNAFWTILMGTYGHREGGLPGVEFPRNAFNAVNAAGGATGGGMSTNLYAGGVFELGPEEALVVENRVPAKPQYMGFQLGNLWGESIDYANALGSLNGHQSETDPDGVIRLVVAHRDPGVPNWLDTTGHPEGFLTPRWAYSETPPRDQWPTLTATKVAFADIRKHLHPSTRTVTPEERREQIRIRQEHVQRRFRVF